MSTVITILTGGRPGLLDKTVSSLALWAPSFVESSRVVALVNGTDERATKILGDLGWVDEVLHHEGTKMLPIGKAISHLMDAVDLGAVDYLFHLEDDWRCQNAGWLSRAEWILRKHKTVGQVRLRKWVPRSTPGAVSRYHMVTKAVLKWDKARTPSFRYMRARAHYTFNPTLTRASVARRVFPCESEMHAARRFHATKCLVAQLLPGTFAHLGGGGRSMRVKTGSK